MISMFPFKYSHPVIMCLKIVVISFPSQDHTLLSMAADLSLPNSVLVLDPSAYKITYLKCKC